MIRGSLLLASALVAIALMGCDRADTSSSMQPEAGSHCTVQFRRDALGAAANLPISPGTSSINGAQVTLNGMLIRSTPEWIVLADHHGNNPQHQRSTELWIPRSSVLYLKVIKKTE